ncbi:MAG: hypothetical protein ACR2PY_02420 [Salinispira sp.]
MKTQKNNTKETENQNSEAGHSTHRVHKGAKKIAKFMLWMIYTVVVGIILLEIIFRILYPISPKPPLVSNNNEQLPLIVYQPNSLFKHAIRGESLRGVKKQTNNYGFVSDIDYVAGSNPDAVVIGDSYVEAFQVDYWDSITGRLNTYYSNSGHAISLGRSGAALIEYLAYTEYAVHEFNPQRLVYVIVGNDFNESFCDERNSNKFYCLDNEFNTIPSTIPQQAKLQKFISQFIHSSSLQWFLNRIFSVDLHQLIKNWVIDRGLFEKDTNKPDYIANVTFSMEPEIFEKSYTAIDYFLEKVGNLAGDIPVLFIVDSDRLNMYERKKFPEAYFEKMRTYFINEAESLDYEVIDLDPIFTQRYATHGEKFEFRQDAHWNELGHEVAFTAILESGFLTQ